MYGAPAPAAAPGSQDQARGDDLLEGDRPQVRHYAGLEGVIKPAIACPSNECRFFVPLL
jgi:hypothetical protein